MTHVGAAKGGSRATSALPAAAVTPLSSAQAVAVLLTACAIGAVRLVSQACALVAGPVCVVGSVEGKVVDKLVI